VFRRDATRLSHQELTGARCALSARFGPWRRELRDTWKAIVNLCSTCSRR